MHKCTIIPVVSQGSVVSVVLVATGVCVATAIEQFDEAPLGHVPLATAVQNIIWTDVFKLHFVNKLNQQNGLHLHCSQ